MNSYVMEIAGHVFCIEHLFPSTKDYCGSFLSNKQPEFSVKIIPADLVQEQKLLEQEALAEGLKIRKFPDPFLERSVIQRKVADYLSGESILMLHGSTVAVDGKAFLFTAPCGTGKSTHTRLWRELFGSRAVMVNDDMPFLEITPGGVFAYGSPWCGKHGLGTNIKVPLQGICLLRRGKENVIHRVDHKCLDDILYQQVHTPADAALADKALSLVERLAVMVAFWEMECNKEPEAAKVSYSAMTDDLENYDGNNN